MAGAKKKKTKPTANPARGFATTSIASKARQDLPLSETGDSVAEAVSAGKIIAPPSNAAAPPSTSSAAGAANNSDLNKNLSPEEFERQLEESELQLLVEKHGAKVKRDAQRQRTRLETDRRLLRSQADAVNSKKWLPQELMDHLLDLIQAESRFASSSVSAENAGTGKMLPEEDMTVKLWTLRLTLSAAAFPEERVQAVLRHILDIAPTVSTSTKESIWGLEEALEWLARECPNEELPSYDNRAKPNLKQAGRCSQIQVDCKILSLTFPRSSYP
jgi:ATP-dependent RNA helicase DHX29